MKNGSVEIPSICTINSLPDKTSFRKPPDLNGEGIWWLSKTIDDGVLGADAILILTEWDEFQSLDWRNISSMMRSPAWVFDTRAVVKAREVKATGLHLWRLGVGGDLHN